MRVLVLLSLIGAAFGQTTTASRNAAAGTNGIVPTAVANLDETVNLQVSFTQPALDIEVCGTSHSFPASTTTLINDGTALEATPAQMASLVLPADGKLTVAAFAAYTPTFTWTAKADTTHYTLLMIDPLLIHGEAGAFGDYVCHMMIVDITGNDIATGTTVVQYLGPGNPSADVANKYTFVLYEQPEAKLTITTEQKTGYEGRGNFDFPKFITDHNLGGTPGTADGINYAFVKNDAVASAELLTLGFATKAALCGTTTTTSTTAPEADTTTPEPEAKLSSACGMTPATGLLAVFAMLLGMFV